MNSFIINQIIDNLKTMPQQLQCQVLEYTRTLISSQITGIPGKQLLRFAGSIPSNDLDIISQTIKKDCERIDIDEW